ncbi:MAG: enoyl-CoA hydratase/isomerase family protein [Tatlockia sp.]|nr:enoyl-CoA hydratase/isomerase family protein [Tatlockia sp.]
MTVDLAFSREKHIGLITLTRPKALNALTLPMITALQQQLQLWQDDESIHAVVIQAEAGKAFCAGGDVRWLYEQGLAKNTEQKQFFWHEYRLNYFIHHYKKPYIALMNGITMGGGVGLSLHGSHPVATENFIFAMPETGIGFFPDVGASFLLARCPGEAGVYLGLTGSRLNADEAYSLRLVKSVVNSKHLPEVLATLVETDLSRDAHNRISACLQKFAQSTSQKFSILQQATIDSYFAKGTVEEILRALAKKGDEWSLATIKTLEKKSPLSLKITFEQIKKAKSFSMEACIKMDYVLVNHFMQNQDFYEGVRALLVDKDNSPNWQPQTLNQVSETQVADYFARLDTLELPLFS